MRDSVREILSFNKAFPTRLLAPKLEKLTTSPFTLFRATFHLFAKDILRGPFCEWPTLKAAGRIVGDLHTENFGTFRAVNGNIVYDINDFDETTTGPYEYDLRRLATSLLLTGLDNGMRLGDGVNATETAIQSYVDTIGRLGRLRRREEFEAEPELAELAAVLKTAQEKSRPEFMQKIVREAEPGSFRFAVEENPRYPRAAKEVCAEVTKRLPEFLQSCLAPKNAEPEKYVLQDVAERIAGAGSVGRVRIAILLGKGKKKETLDSLRLIEWKQALDSSLDKPRPVAMRSRAAEVDEATRAFQLFPKRYLGNAKLFLMPVQAREIGANDDRFKGKQFQQRERFEAAAKVFGALTARAHLLGAAEPVGPRALLREILGRDRQFLHHLLGFAVAYTERVMDDYDQVSARAGEIRKAWDLPER